MNLDKWMRYYQSKPAYRQVDHKHFPCFEVRIESFYSLKQICFPEILETCLKDTPYTCSRLNYYMEASGKVLETTLEEVLIEFTEGDFIYLATLYVNHEQPTVRISFGSNRCEQHSFPEKTKHFLLHIYREMHEFLLQYSPNRLQLVLEDYPIEGPDWLLDALREK